MIGKKFNNWTVIKHIGKRKDSNNWLYSCRCDCGNESIVTGSALRNSRSKGCKSCSNRINGKKSLYAQSKENLYVIKTGPYFKVGSTNNIEKRLKLLKCNCPYPLEVIYHGIGEGKDEELWHKILKHRHHSGEWFKGEL